MKLTGNAAEMTSIFKNVFQIKSQLLYLQ